MEHITKQEFITIWKKITNHPNIKPTFGEYVHEGKTIKARTKGWIYPEHHIIYNLIRGKKINLGFYCGTEKTEGFKTAYENLKLSIKYTYLNNKLYMPFKAHINGELFTKITEEIRLKILEIENNNNI